MYNSQEIIQDQLINAFEFCSIEEMVEHLGANTKGFNVSEMVREWYSVGHTKYWQVSLKGDLLDGQKYLEAFVSNYRK